MTFLSNEVQDLNSELWIAREGFGRTVEGRYLYGRGVIPGQRRGQCEGRESQAVGRPAGARGVTECTQRSAL